MPIFEYDCPKCRRVFEELTRSSDQETRPCPHCGFARAAKILSVCRKANPGAASGAFAGPAPASSGCPPRGGFS